MHLLDKMFPYFTDKLANGKRPAYARTQRCVLYGAPGPNCVANQCMHWKWAYGSLNWRRLLVERRGGCRWGASK